MTQLQHNFNTTSTQHILYFSIYFNICFNIHFILHSTIYETILQHIFITYFHNSSTTNYSILGHKTFIHNLWCNTWSQNFHSQFMMQYFITTIHQTLLTNFRTFISQQTLIYCRDINDRCFISLQQLHHNIFNKHLITKHLITFFNKHFNKL